MNPNLLKNCTGVVLLSILCLQLAARTNVSVLQATSLSPFSFSNAQGMFDVKTLPLTLIYFSASRAPSGKVELSWKTAQEMNVSHFDIEKSLDGRKWTTLGARTAKGQQGSVESYIFADNNPSDGANYYRLHVVDHDGRSDYSPVRLVTIGKETPVRIYPTLTRSNSTVYVEGISPEFAQVEIVNNDGKMMNKVRMYSNTITLPGLPAGLYHVRITNTNTRTPACLQKIIVN